MRLSTRIFFWSVVVTLCFFMQGCVGLVHYRDMELQTQMSNPTILNLHNYESNNITYFKQAEKLIRGKLIKNEGEEYGYYVIKYKSLRCDEDWIFLNCFTFGLVFLFGGPMTDAEFDLSAYLYIFDSNGKLIKEYREDASIIQRAGLYYGHNPTKKVEQKYSELYEKIFNAARLEAEEINGQLLQSGAITEENRNSAEASIKEFFNSLNNK